MLTLAQASQSGPWTLPMRVRAEAAQQEARGLAMTGEAWQHVERKLDEAWTLIDTLPGEASSLGKHYNETLLTMQTAICYCEAGQEATIIAMEMRSQRTMHELSRVLEALTGWRRRLSVRALTDALRSAGLHAP
jgi:hypothetical protein